VVACLSMNPRSGLTLAALLLALAGAAAAQAPASGHAFVAEHGIAVASQGDAARAGAAMYEKGGNAIDAAVATALALAVTQPFSAGLGGGFFALVRDSEGGISALDARETAPAAADRDMYLRKGVPEDASVLGPLAVATPGFVPGIAALHRAWGKLPWKAVLAPAIALAEQGFETGFYHAEVLRALHEHGFEARFP
jgi:gamma-glutamyltranspeptidase/glutathione hydrolase